MLRQSSIAILGAGMGGLALAGALLQRGFKVHVYEQAKRFERLGAGIQMSPNAMKVLRGLGLEERIRSTAFRPNYWANREWDSGEMKFELNLGDEAETRYGAPYLLMHRGDLHEALASRVPSDVISLNKRLVDLQQQDGSVTLKFEDGTSTQVDALIAADGVHSHVREWMLGPEAPRFSGRVAYRTTFPASLLDHSIGECTKWWGPDRHIVIYYVTSNRDEVYFVTSNPEPGWTKESWSQTGDLDELRAVFHGFHDEVQAVLKACPKVHKWALFERDPLPRWSQGHVALLGDACHPMTPYMAQGAASAMEDAIVLSRCIEESSDFETAFKLYEDLRKPRTSQVQNTSHMNTWMRQRTDPSWVYGYDAWQQPTLSTV